jgi:aminoglycoside phosphotransferase family enzyme
MVARQGEGRIRECHGDLRSANIFILAKPVFFDCIEFNDDFRLTDVAGDVGSLVTDLSFFDQSQLVTMFLQSYMDQSLDPSLMQVLPIYIVS